MLDIADALLVLLLEVLRAGLSARKEILHFVINCGFILTFSFVSGKPKQEKKEFGIAQSIA